MKAFYTTILAVVWALTASAQLDPIYKENFDTRTKANATSSDFIFEVSTGNNFTLSIDLPNGAAVTPSLQAGTYLRTANGNDARFVTSKAFTPGSGTVRVSWHEKSDGTTVARRVFCRIVGTTTEINLPSGTGPINAETNWTGARVVSTLTDSRIENKPVEIVWEVTRTQGGQAHYFLDDLLIEAVIPLGTTPVELSSFIGQSSNGAAKLAWTTATELNNDKFEVERSKDGLTFSKVGEVKGGGNSSVKRNYTFTDKSPVGGVNYYRLRQVDTDGTVSFSNVVALQVAGSMAASVYPTVATRAVTISLQNTSGQASIQVTDITGKTVATFNSTTLNELEVPVQNFKSGMYFVRVTDGQNQQVQRFIKE